MKYPLMTIAAFATVPAFVAATTPRHHPVSAVAATGLAVSRTAVADTADTTTDTTTDTTRIKSDSARQSQSGVTNTKTGKSTLGPKIKKTKPTQGQPVTSKGDTLQQGGDTVGAHDTTRHDTTGTHHR